jgi:hypothetical protein
MVARLAWLFIPLLTAVDENPNACNAQQSLSLIHLAISQFQTFSLLFRLRKE